MMDVYINGMGSISPQRTGQDGRFTPAVPPDTDGRLLCVEPSYEEWIDARALRRMSRILRMGTAAGMMALKDAGLAQPDGIITGTGYGCLEDTGTFLARMIHNREEALNPTPFIQSTHNTIGSQLALLLGCQAYNQTYAHGAFSFESAVLDAALLLQENPGHSILTGGVDEVTDVSHAIHKRFGCVGEVGAGMMHGEGAAWFVLSGKPAAASIARVLSLATLYKPDANTLRQGIAQCLADAGITAGDVDLVLTGASANDGHDALLRDVTTGTFGHRAVARYKPLCGEYPVASAFAFWLAASVLRSGHVPVGVLFENMTHPAKCVMVLNQYFGTHYSIALLTSCRATTSSV